jgi:hypothetical protein
MSASFSNPTTSNKIKFSNYTYDKGIFFDEKRKRFVDFDDMDQVSYQEYNSPFIFVHKLFKSFNILVPSRLFRNEEFPS